jgi:predicted nuclease of restriction endonuclease-like (RecB) superfamily
MIRFTHSGCGATQVTTAKQTQSTPCGPSTWHGLAKKRRRPSLSRGQKSSARVAPREKQFLPQAVAEIPWGHNVTLLEKLKDSARRTWYARQATANGWSRSMLDHWIESDLYSRQGSAVTNFKQVLPPPQSDLANEIVRDPYNFDFLTLRTQVAERELENGLLTHIRKIRELQEVVDAIRPPPPATFQREVKR